MCEPFWASALNLWLSWKKEAISTLLPNHGLPSSGSSSFVQRLQNRVEAEHCPGLLDIRSGIPVRKPPDFTLFQGIKLSWELAEGQQGPAGDDHVPRLWLWASGKGSPLPEDRYLSPDLEKGWLAFSPIFALLWKQGQAGLQPRGRTPWKLSGMQGLLAVSRQLCGCRAGSRACLCEGKTDFP